MGVYNSTVITNAGQNLIAQAMAGSGAITVTSVKTSSHNYPAGTDLTALTSISEVKQSESPSSVNVYNKNVVQISARFSNTNVTTAYLIRTLGVYASVGSGSETLIAVLTAATPDQMPVFDEESPSAFIFNIQMLIGNASEITFNVNDTGTANVADIARLQTEINNRVLSNGGNISETIIKSSVATAAELPIPSVGDSVKVFYGKIIKFCNDIVKTFTGANANTAGKKGLVPAPSAGDNVSVLRGDGVWAGIQNNTTTREPGTPLDAAIGYRLALNVQITIAATAWSNSAPYTASIGITKMTENDSPIISVGMPSTIDAANIKAAKKAFAMIDRAVTGDNSITFYCYSKKPTIDIPLQIKGV